MMQFPPQKQPFQPGETSGLPKEVSIFASLQSSSRTHTMTWRGLRVFRPENL